MATVKPRRRADGTPTYRVVWRLGGTRDGSWQSETFLQRPPAVRFCRDVDAAGQQWPEGWVKGVGYVTTEPAAADRPAFLPRHHRHRTTRIRGSLDDRPSVDS
jgi:hypothetical protein